MPERWISPPPTVAGTSPLWGGAGPPLPGLLASLRYLEGGHFVKKNIFFYKKSLLLPSQEGGDNMGGENFLLISYSKNMMVIVYTYTILMNLIFVLFLTFFIA